MKKIMILGASILQLPAIQKAKEMGLEVIAVDMNPDAIGFKEEGIIKEVISTIDIPKVLECAKKHKINGIMTLASDMPMRTVATIAKNMGLIGISEETALKATNKAFMREALKKSKVPIPLFYRVKTKKEYEVAIKTIQKKGYRCIIKPADNSGSRGIKLLDSLNPIDIEKGYIYSIKASKSGELMVEEFMEGPEVSVETLSIDGVCHIIQITDKLTTGKPYFVEMGHSQPSQLSEEVKRKIMEVTVAANHAIGIKNGPSHTEIIVTKDGPKVVELGARLGGDCITTHLTLFSTGVNMVECCIKIALGKQIEIEKKYIRGAAIRYFQTKAGYIKNIKGIEEARQIDEVKEISIAYGIGDKVGVLHNSTDRVGYIITEAENVKKAILIAEQIKNQIEIEIE